MAKKRALPLWFTIVVFALSVFAVIRTTSDSSKQIVPYINDGWVSWDNIEEIKIYSDGYNGRTVDEPIIVTDEKEIKSIVKTVTDSNKYDRIPDDEYLEGQCTIFVDFTNGCVISMYESENYGTVDSRMKSVAENEGYYRFPEKFRKEIFDILKSNEPSK